MADLLSALSASSANDEITVDYVNKKLIVPDAYKLAGVKGDKDSRKMKFRVKKKPDELDLSSATVEIKYANALGETGRYGVTDKATSGDEVTFSFPIPQTLAKESGLVSIELCAHSSDNSKHWHISPSLFEIGDWVEVTEITTDDPKYDIVALLLEAYEKAAGTTPSITETVTKINNLVSDVAALKAWKTNVEAGSTKVVILNQ